MKISDLELEQLLLGELSREKTALFLSDPDVAKKVESLRAENARILARFPCPRDLLPREKAEAPSFARFFRSFALVPALGFAMALVVVGGFFLSRSASDDVTRIKGSGSALVLYRNSGTEIASLKDGESAYAGDSLQLSYAAEGVPYGLIFSVDGNFSLTEHLSGRGFSSVKLEQGGEQLLSYAYLLDDAPDFEIFFFIRSQKPFASRPDLAKQIGKLSGLSAETARAKISRLVASAFGKNCTIYAITIRKDTLK